MDAEEALVVPYYSYFLNRATLSCISGNEFDCLRRYGGTHVAAAKEKAVNSYLARASEFIIVWAPGSQRGEERIPTNLKWNRDRSIFPGCRCTPIFQIDKF